MLIRDSLLVPGGVTKLVGIGVIGDFTVNRERETATFKGYRIRLNINNKENNIIDFDYNDNYLNVYNNTEEKTRLMPIDYKVKSQSRIDYIINTPINVHKSVKLYLKFE